MMNARIFVPELIVLLSVICTAACSTSVYQNQSNAAVLFANAGALYPGSWSDDGALFFATSHEGSLWRVVEIDIQTGDARTLNIDLPGAGVSDSFGNLLLIESVEDADSEIYLFDRTTNALQRLTDNESNEWHPSFFPGGEKIVFDSVRGNQMDLYILDIGASLTEQLTNTAEPEQAGKISPDGQTVAFHRRVGGDDGEYDIVLRNLMSEEEAILVRHSGDDSYPVWGPDGSRIVFSSNRSGNFDLYSICVSGAGLVQLTDDDANEKYPKLSPDGGAIVLQSDAGDRPSLSIMETPALPDCE